MPFAWTINPYRGCEFACSYCYARPTHEYLGYDRREAGSAFEKEIWAKIGGEASLTPERLARAAVAGPIALGTATDPWQPAEEKLQVTRRVLAALSRADGLDISISTRSPLVARDVDLLVEISKRSRLVLRISISTADDELCRRLEPRAPSPTRRFETIRSLVAAELDVRLGLMPIVPVIADSEASLAAVVEAARGAGATGACSNPLFFSAGWRLEGWDLLAARFPEHRAPLLALRDDPKKLESLRVTLQARAARVIHRFELDGDPSMSVSAAGDSGAWLFSDGEAEGAFGSPRTGRRSWGRRGGKFRIR
jgi:DNA repair photolyase